MLLALSTFGSLYGIFWEKLNYDETHEYLNFVFKNEKNKIWKSLLVRTFTRLGTWILVFYNIVPISLIVTIECVKLA